MPCRLWDRYPFTRLRSNHRFVWISPGQVYARAYPGETPLSNQSNQQRLTLQNIGPHVHRCLMETKACVGFTDLYTTLDWVYPVRIASSGCSNFQEFITVRTLKYKKMTKFGPRQFLKINDYEKLRKKEESKREAIFQNFFLLFLSFVVFCVYYPQTFTLRESISRG